MGLKIYPNGLRLSVINRTQTRLVNVCLHITSGTQSEKNYEAGISEFLSRMLLMGTTQHPSARALSNYAKSRGVVLSSDNNSESIIVNAQTTQANIDHAIDILCEIAFDSVFDSAFGDRVRNAMLADIYKLQENPSYILERLVNQALFYRTGLANPKYGTATTISRMTSLDAKEFLTRILTPKNTVISIVGDVDADAVYEKVMQTFYSKFIDGGDYKKLKYVAQVEDFVGGERTKNKKLNQSRIFISFPSLSYKDSRKYVLEIIKPIILRRLSRFLEGTTYFHSEEIVNEFYANNGKITLETMVDYENVNEYLKSIVDAIKDLKKNKVLGDFENEKNAYLVKFLAENDDAKAIAINAAKEVAVQKQSYSVSSEIMKIELLTSADAEKVVDEVFDLSKMYIAYLGLSADINALDYLDGEV